MDLFARCCFFFLIFVVVSANENVDFESFKHEKNMIDILNDFNALMMQAYKDGAITFQQYYNSVYNKLEPAVIKTKEQLYDTYNQTIPLVSNLTRDAKELLHNGYDVMRDKIVQLEKSQFYKHATDVDTYKNFSKHAAKFTMEWYNYIHYASLEVADKLFNLVNGGVDRIKENFDNPTDEL